MLVGFVDGRGRAYDIGFRTLRLSLTDPEGVLETGAGEAIAVQGRGTLSIDIVDGKAVHLLFPLDGDLIATQTRVVFLAAAGVPRKEPFTRFNISLGLHPSAVEHFFTVQGGREFMQFAKGDVESTSARGAATEVVLRGPRPGRAAETARFRARLGPRALADQALAALR